MSNKGLWYLSPIVSKFPLKLLLTENARTNPGETRFCFSYWGVPLK